MPADVCLTVAMESYARRSANYLSRMVDGGGLPYFNVFWTHPAHAAHDWPDFGDVTSRQLQAAVMLRRMTGMELPVERIWREHVLSYLDPADGLLHRPDTPFSGNFAEWGDQALTLYALVTAWLDRPDDGLAAAIFRMVDGMGRRPGAAAPFAIKGLMACARHMGHEAAFRLAERLVAEAFEGGSPSGGPQPLFAPDNTFRHGGHMHLNLRVLAGAADYALAARDPALFSRVDALYRWVRGEATRFGFLPEVIGRRGDVVSCETCALMDFLGLAATLANHGHPEYWADVERTARNHLIESQVADASWLAGDDDRPDSEQFTWRALGERMVGGYAGWSSPVHILAAEETLNAHWGGPELRDKPRAFQNCCGGSGTHAFFIVWKNAARWANGCLSVHLHMDKLLPQAEIRGYQPYRGLLTIDLKEACRVRVRIPDFVEPGAVRAESDGAAVEAQAWGNYLELGPRRAGEKLAVSYPLPVSREECSVGNPGFRRYRYCATWVGDTVVRMEPLANDDAAGYSDYDGRQVPIYYGEAGPGRLYQREALTSCGEPQLATLHPDDGGLDLWC